MLDQNGLEDLGHGTLGERPPVRRPDTLSNRVAERMQLRFIVVPVSPHHANRVANHLAGRNIVAVETSPSTNSTNSTVRLTFMVGI